MDITTLPVGPLETNCYILVIDGTAAVIDPGGDPDIIIKHLQTKQVQVDYIFNTHGHHDHVLANDDIASFTDKKVHIHPDDEYLLKDGQGFLEVLPTEINYSTLPLNEGQVYYLGDSQILVMHTPGHTKGSVSFLVAGNLFCGDLLFKQSIGRTDLDGSSPEDMIESLKRVMKLDKETKVYPGHGPTTSIGEEVNNNPYVLELNI